MSHHSGIRIASYEHAYMSATWNSHGYHFVAPLSGVGKVPLGHLAQMTDVRTI